MNAQGVPEVGDTFVAGYGTWRIRRFEVLHVVQVTPPGHCPGGFRLQVREVEVVEGSPDGLRGVVDEEPYFMHYTGGSGQVRWDRKVGA